MKKIFPFFTNQTTENSDQIPPNFNYKNAAAKIALVLMMVAYLKKIRGGYNAITEGMPSCKLAPFVGTYWFIKAFYQRFLKEDNKAMNETHQQRSQHL